MTLADLAKLLIGAIIGFIGGFFTRWPLDKLTERRALLKSMGDRYIANTQANSNQQGDDHRGFDLISDALPFGRLW